MCGASPLDVAARTINLAETGDGIVIDMETPEEILSRYPAVHGNALAMARQCAILRQKELYDDALALGMVAIRQAPHDMAIRDIVRQALSTGVPRYHWRMLRDRPRNAVYARAIARTVRPGMTVLEIGTGAGLLALIAARAGARVITCEANPMIAAAAREIVRRNGLSDRITVVAKPSHALVPGVELPEPADLLVHEIFGDTLFNEGVVASLTDARRRLVKQDAIILPRSAELRIALAGCATGEDAPLGAPEGFDLTPFDLLQRPAPLRIDRTSTRWERRSEACSVLATDFTQSDIAANRSETVRLTSCGGRVHGVAQWMRIDFGDGDVLENDPFGTQASHWKAPLFDLDEPIDTDPRDLFDIRCKVEGTHVRMNAIAMAERGDVA